MRRRSLEKIMKQKNLIVEKNPNHPPRERVGQRTVEGLAKIQEALEAVATLLEYRADLQNDNAKLADDGGAFIRGMAVIVSECAAQAERHQKDANGGVTWLRRI